MEDSSVSEVSCCVEGAVWKQSMEHWSAPHRVTKTSSLDVLKLRCLWDLYIEMSSKLLFSWLQS